MVGIKYYWIGLEEKEKTFSCVSSNVPLTGDSVVVDRISESNPKKRQCLHVFKRVWVSCNEVELHCDRVD